MTGQLSERFAGFVIDLDGVVWLGDDALPGAARTLEALHAAGKRTVFLTNDPRSSRSDHASKLTRLGIPARAEDVVTSASAVADFVAEREPAAARTYVVGSDALRVEVEERGLVLVDHGDAASATAVVVGGHERFGYAELRAAAAALRSGAAFYATNRDPTFPMPGGPWPATGAILAAVEVASGREAVTVGKPEPWIFEIAAAALGDCEPVAIVGDDLTTDIAGGERAGLATILVLTGATSRDDLGAARTRPDHVLASLAELA